MYPHLEHMSDRPSLLAGRNSSQTGPRSPLNWNALFREGKAMAGKLVRITIAPVLSMYASFPVPSFVAASPSRNGGGASRFFGPLVHTKLVRMTLLPVASM